MENGRVSYKMKNKRQEMVENYSFNLGEKRWNQTRLNGKWREKG
jgi:hypothetical protein